MVLSDATEHFSHDHAVRNDAESNAAIDEYRQVASTYSALRMKIAVTETHLARLRREMDDVAEQADRAVERLGGDPLGILLPAAAPKRRRDRGETRASILASLPGTVAELAAATGSAQNTIRTTLRMMMRRGEVLRTQTTAPTHAGPRVFTYRAAPRPDEDPDAPSGHSPPAPAPR